MNSQYFLDTNVFLRLIVRDNEKFLDECSTLFKKVENGEIRVATSGVIITEIAWTLRTYYKFSKDSIIEVLQLITGIRNLEIFDVYDVIEAVDIFSKKNIKFVDALIASCPLIKLGKIKLVSYDKDFDKIGILRLEPKDII